MSNKRVERIERSAATNALIGLAAAKLAEPYAKDAYKKLKDKKDK